MKPGVALEYLTGYGWVDNMKNIMPGEGYKVRTNANTTFSLSNDMGANLKSLYFVMLPTHFQPVYVGNGLDHMNIDYLRSTIQMMG